MREKLCDTKWCRSDFEQYDIPRIEECTEPFFWNVNENGTTLSFIGPTQMNKWLSDESCRLQLARDIYTPLWPDNGRGVVWSWDGCDLRKVTWTEEKTIFYNMWYPTIVAELQKHPKELSMYDKPLEFCFIGKAEERKRKCEELEKELGNNSFSECLMRLSRWARCAVEHRINICTDFLENSFYFTEFVNGKPMCNGGIVFSDGKWQIHT